MAAANSFFDHYWHSFFQIPVCMMHRNNDKPSGLKTSTQAAVEVRLWEIYLLRSRNNLNTILSGYSLDKGPLRKNPDDPERVVFRFLTYDWEKSVKNLLLHCNTPFEIVHEFQLDVFQQPAKKRIYVVEDDLHILFALNTMLEDAGYDVILSHCGAPMLQENLPATDLFILDKRMPDIDGIEVSRHLRSQKATQHTPIVMISASRNFSQQAFKAGVNDCLEKPFHMQDLLRVVAKHTDNKTQTSGHRHLV
jgi:CheY-like chemotaxis protein